MRLAVNSDDVCNRLTKPLKDVSFTGCITEQIITYQGQSLDQFLVAVVWLSLVKMRSQQMKRFHWFLDENQFCRFEYIYYCHLSLVKVCRTV